MNVEKERKKKNGEREIDKWANLSLTKVSLSILIENNKIMRGVFSSSLPLFYSVHEQIHDLRVSHSKDHNLSVSCSKFCLGFKPCHYADVM